MTMCSHVKSVDLYYCLYAISDEPFPENRDRLLVVLTCTNGVSPNHLPVIVASEFEGGLNLLNEADDDAAM